MAIVNPFLNPVAPSPTAPSPEADPAASSQQSRFVNPFIAQPSSTTAKPLGLLDTGLMIGGQIVDAAAYELPAAIAGAIEGDQPYAEDDWKDALIRRAEENRKPPGPIQETAIPGIDTGAISNLGPSLGFSVVGMGAGLGAGIAAAPLAPLTLGSAPVVAGGAASFAAAQRMAENNFVRELYKAANEQSMEDTGKPIAPEAFAAKQAELADEIRAYGLWEAVPEAAGNVIGFGILKAPIAGAVGRLFGKNVLTRFASKTAAVMGSELATETPTQMGQQRAESRAGLTDEAPREFTSPEDWKTSFKEVAPSTILQTALLAGGAKGVMALRRTTPEAQGETPREQSSIGPVTLAEIEQMRVQRLAQLDQEERGQEGGVVTNPEGGIDVIAPRIGRELSPQEKGERLFLTTRPPEAIARRYGLEIAKPADAEIAAPIIAAQDEDQAIAEFEKAATANVPAIESRKVDILGDAGREAEQALPSITVPDLAQVEVEQPAVAQAPVEQTLAATLAPESVPAVSSDTTPKTAMQIAFERAQQQSAARQPPADQAQATQPTTGADVASATVPVAPQTAAQAVTAPQALPEATRAPVEQRNPTRQERIAQMTPADIEQELYVSRATGIKNRRALDEDMQEGKKAVTFIDLDGLKYINDTLGHEKGNELLKKFADAMKAAGIDGYHISGDEFAILSDNMVKAKQAIKALEAEAKKARIDSDTDSLQGITFSYGMSKDLATADANMQKMKASREQAGLRVRGGRPPNLVARLAPPSQPAPRPRGRRLQPFTDNRLSDPEARLTLQAMADAAGWAEVGGRLTRGSEGNVGRTKWIPRADWFGDIQADKGSKLTGNLKGLATRVAVQKALSGEPMTEAQKRHVIAMLEWKSQEQLDYEAQNTGSIDPFTLLMSADDANIEYDESLSDEALAARAWEIDEEAVNRAMAASEYETEFLNEMRRIVDGEANRQGEDQAVGRSGESVQGAEASPASPESQGGFSLTGQTEAQRVAEEARKKAEKKAKDEADAAAEERARVDREARNFELGAPTNQSDLQEQEIRQRADEAEAKARKEEAAEKPPEEDADDGRYSMVSSGEVLRSESGRVMSPVPRIDTSTAGKTNMSLKRLREWLLSEARQEATGSRHLTTILSGLDAKRLSQSDMDSLNAILFGDERGPKPRHRVTAPNNPAKQLSEPQQEYSNERDVAPLQNGKYPESGVRETNDAGSGQLSLFAAPTADKRQAYADLYGTVIKARTVAHLKASSNSVKAPEDVAHLLASIRKNAQEALYAVVTDKRGKVLRVILHTRGLKTESSVSPLTLIAEVASIPEAARVHLGHNHPSGDPTPSRADIAITEKIRALMDGTGISLGHHVVVAGKAWGNVDATGHTTLIEPLARTTSVPVTERVITKRGTVGDRITTPDAAVRVTAGHKDAVFLLNAQHDPVGIVPLTADEMKTLRSGGSVNRLLSAINTTNASAAIIKTDDRSAALNVIKFLNRFDRNDLRVLDWISAGGVSMASSGDSALDATGPFFSRGQEASPKTINVDGVDRPTTNSEGQRIHPTEEGIRNFWEWFSGSAAVDADGRPLVVYRGEGGGDDFDIFDKRKTRENSFFFTADENVARDYGNGNEPRAFYLKADRVLDLTKDSREAINFIREWAKAWNDEGWVDRASGEDIDPVDVVLSGRLFDYEGDWSSRRWLDLQASIQEAGYDGAVLPDTHVEPSESIIVFSEEQIKSATGNSGEFSRSDARIHKSAGEGRQGEHTVASVTSNIEAKLGKGALSKIADNFKIVKDMAALKADMEKRGSKFVELVASKEGFLTKGLYDPSTDTSYIVAGNLNVEDSPYGIFLHEVGEHYGLEKMLGPEAYKGVLNQAQMILRAGGKAMREAAVRVNASENVGLDPEAKNFHRLFADKMAGNKRLSREVIAYLADNPKNHELPFMRRIMVAVREFMRKLGFTKPLTTDDIVSLITTAARRSVEFATRGGEASTETIKFGGAARPTTNSEGQPIHPTEDGIRNFWRWFSPQPSQLLEGLSVSEIRSLERHTKALSDFIERQSSLSETDRFRVIPRSVLAHMVGVVNNDKILDAVIRSIPVDVVDFLSRKKWSAKEALHDVSVLKDVLAVDPETDVSLGVNPSSYPELAVRLIANAGAKITGLTDGALERNSAVLANENDPVLGAHVAKSPNKDLGILAGFGDSRVVDADGKPLVVYHGTNADLTDFDTAPRGSFFTDSQQVASGYGRPVPVYLAMKNPVIIDAKGAFWNELDTVDSPALDELRKYGRVVVMDHIKSAAEKAGYDGAIVMNVVDNGGATNQYIAFRPEQIKSALGNQGSYDPSDPSILRSVGQRTAAQAIAQQPLFSRKNLDEAGSLVGSKFTLPAETLAQKAQRYAQDEANRFQVIQDAVVKQGGTVDESSNIADAIKRYPGRLAAAMKDTTETLVEPFAKRIHDAGTTTDEVSLLAYAEHAPERNAEIAKINPRFPNDGTPGKSGSGMTDQEAADIIKQVKAMPNAAEMFRLSQELRDITDQNLDNLVAGGEMEQSQADEYRKRYKFYVPLKGFELVDESGMTQPTGKGLSTGSRLGFRAMGRESRAGQIFEHVIQDYENGLMLSEKAVVAKTLRNFIKANPDDALWTIDNAPKKPRLEKGGSLYQIIAGGNLIAETASKDYADRQVQALLPTDPTAYVAEVKPSPKGLVKWRDSPFDPEEEIRFIENGKPVRIQLADAGMVRSYNRLWHAGVSDGLTLLNSYNGWLRQMYTQKNPAWFFLNAQKDVLSVMPYVTGEAGIKTALKIPGNIPGALKAAWAFHHGKTAGAKWNALIEQFKATGGYTGFAFVGDIEAQTDRLNGAIARHTGWDEALGKFRTKGVKAGISAIGAKAMNTAFFSWIEAMNSTFENMTRLAVFKSALDSGMTPNEAGKLAKNASTNFNTRGEWGPNINAVWLFANAGIQGTRNVGHALMFSPHKEQVWALMGGLVALGVMTGLMSDDDDDLLDDQIRSKSLVFKVGDTQLSLPMPYGFGFFSGFGQLAAQAMKHPEKRDNIALKMATLAFDHFSPVEDPLSGEADLKNVVNIAPTSIRPVLNVAANVSPFGGGPLFPESPYDETKPDSTKMWTATRGTGYDNTAKWLNALTGGDQYKAGAISVSPETLKLSVSTLFGGAGKLASDILSLPFDVANETLAPSKVPILKNYVREVDQKAYLGRFYDQAQEAQDAYTIWRRYLKAGMVDEATSYKQGEAAMISMGGLVSSYRKQIKMLRDMESMIVNSDLSPTEKNIRLAKTNASIVQITSAFNDRLKSFQ